MKQQERWMNPPNIQVIMGLGELWSFTAVRYLEFVSQSDLSNGINQWISEFNINIRND